MCGLKAIYAYRNAAPAVRREELVAMRDHMAARGPDGAGLWIAEDGRFSLSHPRLTITATQNPRYHRLIDAFRAETDVPMVLNTSFNENEPVVCRPKEAIDCFLRTKMDLLVLGDQMVRRV